MVVRDLAVGAKLAGCSVCEKFPKGASYRRKDECGTPSNKLESDWPLSLGCWGMVASVFLGPMDLG